MKVINTQTGETFKAKNRSQALLIATTKHNEIKRATGQKVRFKITD